MWQQGNECDGECYTDEGIYPRAEWCDKTRKGEFYGNSTGRILLFGGAGNAGTGNNRIKNNGLGI